MATDDEMAFKLVELYVKDVAQKHEKSGMGLNTIINAYIWSLARIRHKKEELGMVEQSKDLKTQEKQFQQELSDGNLEDILYEEKPKGNFGF